MRPQSYGLNDTANCTSFDQLTSPDCRAVFEALAVHYRVDAAGLGLHPADLGKLVKCRDARFVGHVVFAVLHHPDTKRSAVRRNGGADHKLNRWILEDLRFAPGRFSLREALGEAGGKVGLFRVEQGKLASPAEDGIDLAVDVGVVDADDSELDSGRRCYGLLDCWS